MIPRVSHTESQHPVLESSCFCSWGGGGDKQQPLCLGSLSGCKKVNNSGYTSPRATGSHPHAPQPSDPEGPSAPAKHCPSGVLCSWLEGRQAGRRAPPPHRFYHFPGWAQPREAGTSGSSPGHCFTSVHLSVRPTVRQGSTAFWLCDPGQDA